MSYKNMTPKMFTLIACAWNLRPFDLRAFNLQLLINDRFIYDHILSSFTTKLFVIIDLYVDYLHDIMNISYLRPHHVF